MKTKTDASMAWQACQAMVKAVCMALCLAVIPAIPCAAQQTRTSIVLAWAELEADGVDPEYEYARILVPRQLMAALSFISERYPTREEADAARFKTNQLALESARKAVAEARSQRDLKYLAIKDSARRASELLAAEESIKKAESALEGIKDTQGGDTAALPVSSSGPDAGPQGSGSKPPPGAQGAGPVQLTRWQGHADGSLLPAVLQPALVCAEKKLDLLLHGRLRQRGAYLAIELSLYVAALGRDVWTDTDYAFADGLEDSVAALVRPVATAVLGRPYSRVLLDISPPVADISVDGRQLAASPLIFHEAGTHELLARAIGFDSLRQTFTTEPGTDTVLEIALSVQPSVSQTLHSQPEGASIYIDGTRQGSAPFELSGAPYPRVARLSMPGYDDAQFVVRPGSMLETITLPLSLSDGKSFDERFDGKKDAFYHSLGWFVASLPLTVLSGGMFQTFYATNTEYSKIEPAKQDPAVIERLSGGYYAFQTAFWASAAVSLGLAVNAFIQLAFYLGSSQ